jgi:integrase
VAPQRRGANKHGWPANLYERDGYFAWRNPLDRKEFGLGRDRRKAFAQAIEANLHVAGQLTQDRLVDRLTGASGRTWGDWLDRYEKQLGKRKLAENTRKTYKSTAGRARTLLGENAVIERISTLAVSEAIDSVVKEGKDRSAQALRTFLTDAFRAAVAAGWIQTNPVLVTEKVQVEIRRSRLTLDAFQSLYKAAGDSWLRNAMALALVTAQRREDVVRAQFADVRDGGWWCEQRKTGNRVFLPLELKLDCFGMSLGDVVKQCRGTGVLSKHLVHQVSPRGNSPVGRAIWIDTVSKRFADLVRDSGLAWGDRTPPTFHEIRSLAAREYEKQGGIDVQSLLGHRDPRMTQVYKDSRGAEWVRVKLA